MYSHGQYRRRIIMLDCLKKIDKAKTGILQQAFYSEQQASRFSPVMMRRSFTQTVQQPFFVQRNVF